MKHTAGCGPLINPSEVLPRILPVLRMLIRLSNADFPFSFSVFFVRWIRYGDRSGRALNGRSSNWGRPTFAPGSSWMADSTAPHSFLTGFGVPSELLHEIRIGSSDQHARRA